MSRLGLLVLGLSGLAACSAPVRTVAWFKVHPDIAAKVAAVCGPSRSPDCANAEQGLADARHDQRLSAYRKAF